MGAHRLDVFFPAGTNSGVPYPETAEERGRRLFRFLSELAGVARHFGSAVFFLHHDLLIGGSRIPERRWNHATQIKPEFVSELQRSVTSCFRWPDTIGYNSFQVRKAFDPCPRYSKAEFAPQ